jgi:hypothetical protein
MNQPETKEDYWGAARLLLWTAVMLLIFGGAAFFVGHFIFGRFWTAYRFIVHRILSPASGACDRNQGASPLARAFSPVDNLAFMLKNRIHSDGHNSPGAGFVNEKLGLGIKCCEWVAPLVCDLLAFPDAAIRLLSADSRRVRDVRAQFSAPRIAQPFFLPGIFSA